MNNNKKKSQSKSQSQSLSLSLSQSQSQSLSQSLSLSQSQLQSQSQLTKKKSKLKTQLTKKKSKLKTQLTKKKSKLKNLPNIFLKNSKININPIILQMNNDFLQKYDLQFNLKDFNYNELDKDLFYDDIPFSYKYNNGKTLSLFKNNNQIAIGILRFYESNIINISKDIFFNIKNIKDIAEIGDVYIYEEFRGKFFNNFDIKWSNLLLEYALLKSKEYYDFIWLWTTNDNIVAIKLYEKYFIEFKNVNLCFYLSKIHKVDYNKIKCFYLLTKYI